MLRKQQTLNAIPILIVLLLSALFVQAVGSEELAKSFFAKKEYEQALPLYAELHALYPSESMFNYCYGVCLTQTGNYGQEAKKVLLQASLNDAPSDVYFYIGKNYHAQGDFQTALSYYNRFNGLTNRKMKKEFDLANVMDQCNNEINPFDTTLTSKAEIKIEDTESETVTEDLLPVGETEAQEFGTINTVEAGDTIAKPVNNQTQIEIIKEFEIPERLADTLINFNLTALIHYYHINQFRTIDAQHSFVYAWENQQQLDSIMEETKQLRDSYDQAESVDEMKGIAEQILLNEQKSLDLKVEIDQNYFNAKETEMTYWNSAIQDEKGLLQYENDSILNLFSIGDRGKEQAQPNTPVEDYDVEESDSLEMDIPVISANINSEEPSVEKVVYKVQIGTYSQKLPNNVKVQYDKLSKVRKIDTFTNEKGIDVYTIGEVSNIKDAVALQKQIRQEGIKDAFVVAYKNGKRITLDEAREITGK